MRLASLGGLEDSQKGNTAIFVFPFRCADHSTPSMGQSLGVIAFIAGLVGVDRQGDEGVWSSSDRILDQLSLAKVVAIIASPTTTLQRDDRSDPLTSIDKRPLTT